MRRIAWASSYSMPILMPFVDAGIESFAILALVLIRVEMPIADTNPHSSMVGEDGNDRVAVCRNTRGSSLPLLPEN